MRERLEASVYSAIIDLALSEDIGLGDITTRATVDRNTKATARLIAKQELVLCGVDVARHVFARTDPGARVLAAREDGERLQAGDEVMVIEGTAAGLLSGERVALNFMQRLSGVATLTAEYVKAAKGTRASLVDTRKTTPGLRALEKYAVRCAGGKNHRIGLFDAVLIKENHIRAAGGLARAVTSAKAYAPHLTRIEVEVTNLDELNQALDAGADVIMLDNFGVAEIEEAVAVTKGRAMLEVSGSVDLISVGPLAATGVDLISVGRLTHSAPAVDISMLFDC